MNGMSYRQLGGEKWLGEATIRNYRIVGPAGRLSNYSGILNSSTPRLTAARLSSIYLATSLQLASAAGRRAVSKGAALAYFINSALSACSAVTRETRGNRRERRERRGLGLEIVGLWEGLVR